MRYKQAVRRHTGGNLIEEKGEEEEEETREIEGQKTGRITVMYVGKTGIGPKTATTELKGKDMTTELIGKGRTADND